MSEQDDAARGLTQRTPQQPYDVTESDQPTDGEMGVSSEREGHTGPGQHGTTGTRDVGPVDPDEPVGDVVPEQSVGGPEVHPDPPRPPVAGYSSSDPRSKE